jgi:predicted GIY-YIG superfamily endonuclease
MLPLSSIDSLRLGGWTSVPTDPGIYWWYFPESSVADFQLDKHCELRDLELRRSEDGMVCLYHGCASNLRQRVKWHAAQSLHQSALKSGYTSTFRFTLLALTGFDYSSADMEINQLMDGLQIHWKQFKSKSEAKEAESLELAGRYHYPLNIQENRRVELAGFTAHLKRMRKEYKRTHLG